MSDVLGSDVVLAVDEIQPVEDGLRLSPCDALEAVVPTPQDVAVQPPERHGVASQEGQQLVVPEQVLSAEGADLLDGLGRRHERCRGLHELVEPTREDVPAIGAEEIALDPFAEFGVAADAEARGDVRQVQKERELELLERVAQPLGQEASRDFRLSGNDRRRASTIPDDAVSTSHEQRGEDGDTDGQPVVVGKPREHGSVLSDGVQ